MSLSSTQAGAASDALDDIEQERRYALMQVESSWDLFSGDTAKNAAVSYLKGTAVKAMESLRNQLDRVSAGTMDWNTWVANAAELRKSIQDVAGYSSEWSLLGVLSDVGSATAKDVGTGATKVYAAASSGTTWGVGAFLLLGVAYVWLSRGRG